MTIKINDVHRKTAPLVRKSGHTCPPDLLEVLNETFAAPLDPFAAAVALERSLLLPPAAAVSRHQQRRPLCRCRGNAVNADQGRRRLTEPTAHISASANGSAHRTIAATCHWKTRSRSDASIPSHLAR
jgi:hypothetical protein